MGLDGCVPAEGSEVRVRVEDSRSMTNGDGTDEAVDQPAHRLAAAATGAVQRGRALVVHWLGWQRRRPGHQSSKVSEVGVVSAAGEDLHANWIAGCDVAGEEPIHLFADR